MLREPNEAKVKILNFKINLNEEDLFIFCNLDGICNENVQESS